MTKKRLGKASKRDLYNSGQKGAALFIAVFFFLTTSLVVVNGLAGPLVREYNGARNTIVSTQAYYLAEAGGEDAFYRVKNSMSISATETLVLGGATASVTIADVSGGKRIFSKAVKNLRTRAMQTEISSAVTNVDFVYAARVGDGGIIMDNNSTISGFGGVPGDIMSNGPVVGGNGTQITGDVVVTSDLSGAQATSTTCNTDQIVGKVSAQTDFAQSFKAVRSGALSNVRLYLKKNGVPANPTIYIVSDNAGEPSMVTLASAILDGDNVGSDYAWIDVLFSTPLSVVSGQTYWIVFDGEQHSNKYWTWCEDSIEGYTVGESKYTDDWSAGSWNPSTGDLAFKTVVGEVRSIIDGINVLGIAKANIIRDSVIGGNAYFQVRENTTVSGTEYANSADPPTVPMPLASSTIDGWKIEAENGGVISGNCPDDPACSLNMGPGKIDGNLVIDTNGTTLTLDGVVYVTGYVDFNNIVTVQCNGFYGTNSCMLIADGYINADNNVTFAGSGQPESFMLLISTKEGCLGGSQQPGCASQNSAIYAANNVFGGILYSTDSQVYINNGVDIDAVVAHKFHLAAVASVIYKAEVGTLSFLSDVLGGGSGSWLVNDWEEVE